MKKGLKHLCLILAIIFVIQIPGMSVMASSEMIGVGSVGVSETIGNSSEKPMVSETELVVVFSDKPERGVSQHQHELRHEARVQQSLERIGIRTDRVRRERREESESNSFVTVRLSKNKDMKSAIAALEAVEGVEVVEPLVYFYANEFNDPRAGSQWALPVIDAFDAWNGNTGLSSVIIAIVDSGVRLTHEDLAASIVPGYDFIDFDSNPADMYGHGTHVAGIAAAISGNGVGIASPAGGAKIMPVRVLGTDGYGTSISVANGIRFAADNGADIINLSLGSDAYSSIIEDAVNYALTKGCLIVASSGNDYRKSGISYPAAHSGVIIAASLTENQDYIVIESDFSNYASAPFYANRTIHAPGDSIVSTDYSGNSSYSVSRGTSASAPYISGMAAALLARGEFSGSLYNALLNATVSLPRYYKSGSNILLAPGASMKVLNDNGNMDAYKNQTFTVTFSGNGHPIPAPQYVKYGEQATRPANDPVLANHQFLGWKRSGDSQLYDFSRPVYSSFTINSTWDVIQNYRINVQSDVNGNAFADEIEALAGARVTVMATPNRGFRFKEWSIISGSPTFSSLTANPASFIMPNSNVTVRAIFEPVTMLGNGVTELSFTPAHAVQNDDGSIIYLSDKTGKRVYKIDTKTFEQKFISFELMPESMYYKNGKLYVSLLEWEHSYTRMTAEQRGAFAVIDCASFTVIDQHSINLDPYSIVVSDNGHIYIGSGSGQWTEMHAFQPNGTFLDSVSRFGHRSIIKHNADLDRIYAIDTTSSPRSMFAFYLDSDGTFITKDYFDNKWRYHGDFSSTISFTITPDDKFIFNGAGYVLQCSADRAEDMVKIRDLDRGYVDIAFDLPDNTFYTAMNNGIIHSFRYDTFQPGKSYSVINGMPESVFLAADDIIALTRAANNTYYLEQIPKSGQFAGMYSISTHTLGNGSASASLSEAEPGTEVTIFAAPDSGSDFVCWEVNSGNITLSDTHSATATFIMPDENVSVCAIFEYITVQPENGAALPFTPADAVINGDGSFIYLSDLSRKRVYRVNTQTFEQSYLTFSLMPESMYFKGGKLYVSLCEQEHNSGWWNENQRGAFAIIDDATFTVDSQVSIDIDPYGIVVSNDNIIYIASGSGQWTNINGYSPAGQIIARGQIRHRSTIKYSSVLNKIYAITSDLSPRNMSAYIIQGDGSFLDRGGNMGTSYNWPYHGAFSSAINFEVSPDGQYIFNGIGYILNCAAGQAGDMVTNRQLEQGFKDIVFDLFEDKYYIASTGNTAREILSFSYSTHMLQEAYAVVNGSPERVFLAKKGILALTRSADNLHYIEWAGSKPAIDGVLSITGLAKFGQELRADAAGLTSVGGAPGAITYQWKRAGVNIAGATNSAYTLVKEDIGQTLTVTATANNGISSVTSDQSAVVSKADGPAAPASPAIFGKTKTSVTLNAITGAEYMLLSTEDVWGNVGGWQDSTVFGGLVANVEYTFFARLKETATHEASPVSVASTPVTVEGADTNTNALTGTATINNMSPKIGDVLNGSYTPGNNSGTLTYTWKSGAVTLGTGAAYTVQTRDLGNMITLEITSSVETGKVTSTATAAVVKKAGPAAPEAPTLVSATNSSVTLTANAAYEFSRNGTTWQTSNVFSGLTSNTAYTFYQRIAATADTLASAASLGLSVTTSTSGSSPGGGPSGGGGGGSSSNNPSGSFTGGISTYEKGSEDNFVFTVNKDFDLFRDVRVGGNALTKNSQYEARGSSAVVITLLTGYLDSLSVGKYTLEVRFTDGTAAKAEFTVAEQAAKTEAKSESESDNAVVIGEPVIPQGAPFADVPADSWFAGPVMWAAQNGYMTGTSTEPRLFSPGAPLTRGMVVTVLYRHALGTDASIRPSNMQNSFGDVTPGAWYADAVLWASANGIVVGYGDGKFGPNDNITREQMATMLRSYCNWRGSDLSAREGADLSGYQDASSVSNWALPSMKWANGAGIIGGKPGGYLDPQGNATRAEFASVLMRFVETVK